jgi:hypothetical protein
MRTICSVLYGADPDERITVSMGLDVHVDSIVIGAGGFIWDIARQVAPNPLNRADRVALQSAALAQSQEKSGPIGAYQRQGHHRELTVIRAATHTQNRDRIPARSAGFRPDLAYEHRAQGADWQKLNEAQSVEGELN